MFIPSTACVLFCRHLLDMQGTKGINNIHPNVFAEIGVRNIGVDLSDLGYR